MALMPDPQHQPEGSEKAAKSEAVGEIGDWTAGYLRRHPKTSLETVGEQFILGIRAIQWMIVDIFTRRFPFVEFVEQAAFMTRTAVLPTLLVTIPIGVTLSVQFQLLAGQVGATSLAGAASGLTVIRQGAPLVAAILMASAVGSAICADLGSRRIRDEIDAMEVMGVQVVRRLVSPRLAAGMVVAVALTGFTCFVGFLAGYIFNTFVQHGTPGSFLATFDSFATDGDFILTIIKAAVFGAIVTIVGCQKGLSAKGGPGGVANAVNASVVASILLLMIVNVVFTQVYELAFPRQGF